jgi:hypothetical protein
MASEALGLELTWTVTSHGWARCTWRHGSDTVELRTSYVGDALAGLFRAALDLKLGSSATLAHLPGEPGGWRIFFSGATELVLVQIVRFPDLSSPERWWAGGQLVWSARVRTDEMIAAILDMGERARAAYPPQDYEQRWGKPFPEADLDLLRGRASADRSA